MPRSLLSERAVNRWFRGYHRSPASKRQQALAARLGPTVAAPDRLELEDICGDHILEERQRVLLAVGTLLVRAGRQDVWRQVYQTVEEAPHPDGETSLLAELTAAARAGEI